MDRCQILLWHLNTIHDWQKLAFLNSFSQDGDIFDQEDIWVDGTTEYQYQHSLVKNIISKKYNFYIFILHIESRKD